MVPARSAREFRLVEPGEYSVVFVKGAPTAMPVRDVTEQGLVNAMTDAAKKGMSATNVSVVSLGGERHHTALFPSGTAAGP